VPSSRQARKTTYPKIKTILRFLIILRQLVVDEERIDLDRRQGPSCNPATHNVAGLISPKPLSTQDQIVMQVRPEGVGEGFTRAQRAKVPSLRHDGKCSRVRYLAIN
jgi:hypothetical protein